MMRLLTFTILLIFSGLANAQDPIISLDVSTKDDDSGKKLAGSTVEVYKDGSLFVTKQSASSGRVPIIDLPIGHNYKIIIKKEGYVAKVATLDGHFDYPEDLPPFVPFPIQTSLFRVVEGVDFAWLETTPMIKFELDQYGNQTWDQAYTKGMLKKIEQLKKELAAKAEEDTQKQLDFDSYVKTADKNVSGEEYEKAIQNYNMALEIFSDKPDVIKKRDAAQKAWDDQQAGAEKEKLFSDKMAEAKGKYTAKSYKEALALYKEASTIKPTEELPKTRIKEIEKLLADEKANEDKFNKFVADGDKAMGTETFDDAISNYESALLVKDDAGVQTKLENAKKKKQEKEDADAANKEAEEQYNKLIADADKDFNAKSYEDSKSKYQEALNLKPGESIPAARISEIDEILKKLRENEDAAKKLEEDYKRLIDEGDAAFGSNNWQGSIDKYKAALDLKSGESHPTAQIKIAEKNLEDEAKDAAKNEEYSKLMADAKSLKDGEKYKEAIAKYKEALGVKPTESDPNTRIAEIEQLLNDLAGAKEKEEKYQKHMADGNSAQSTENLAKALAEFESALSTKPGDGDAQTKIDEIEKLIKDKEDAEAAEKKFTEYVAAGDKSFTDKSYTDAKVNYQKALDIKADQAVKDKIAEIDKIMAKNQNAEEVQQKYDAAIKKADDAFNSKDWENALANYEEAYAIKDEAYAKDRITTVKGKIAELADADAKEKMFNDLVAEGDDFNGSKDYMSAIKKYQEAIKMKPDVSVSKKIADIEAILKEESANNEVLQKYLAKIKEADAAFNSDKWESAKTLYTNAIDIKGDEEYPKSQLLEIDKKMKEDSDSELEKEYQKIIAEAQSKMDAEDYDKAIELFTRAKEVKPSDPLPQQKIDEIAEIKRQKEAMLADKEAFEKKYSDLIKAADENTASKDYIEAVKKYKEALTMKPTESYPQQKIDAINKILNEEDAGAALDEKYEAALKVADDLFASENYLEAKSAYQDALDIKGGEQYPKTKIAECDDKLKDQSDNEVEKQYQKILTVAQKKMTEEDYEKSLELYNRAKSMKPSDPLPQQRIDEINQILKEKSSEKEQRDRFDDLIRKADTYFERGEFEKALPVYMTALDIYNEQYPRDQVEKCRTKMVEDKSGENKQYDKLIAKADEYFDAANYEKAKNLYKRATGIKPSDMHPKNRLKEIEKILNPPKNHVANSNGLNDYGPAVNERPIDIEAMLIEAEEQSRYFEYKKIYKQREDANAALEDWAVDGIDKNHKTKEHVEYLQLKSEQIGVTGENGRQAYSDEVVVMQDEREERITALTNDHENNIQYQNKKVEAIKLEIEKNNMNNDKAREEYLLDVEVIKIAVENKTRTDAVDQIDKTYEDKEGIEKQTLAHVTNDPNNDVNRLNTVVEVEDMQIDLINATNENSWDQEDEIMNTKVELELMVDDIIANNLQSDLPRTDYIEIVEDIHLSHDKRDTKNSQDQYDKNMEAKDYTEEMIIEIEKNNIDNDVPRQDAELYVERTQVDFDNRNGSNNKAQTNVIMNNDVALEKIEMDINDANGKMDKRREGYEKVIEDVHVEINDYNGKMADDNADNGFDAKDYTEDMIDQKMKKDKEGSDKQTINEDRTADMIEDHIEIIEEKNEINAKGLENSEDYIELIKDIDVRDVTPKMQNELGQKFPEGVTEESFEINDSNGLLKSYIVRRIVVQNGVGSVYEKTQTRYGATTYTRNGQPVSEFQWSDETSGLTRN